MQCALKWFKDRVQLLVIVGAITYQKKRERKEEGGKKKRETAR
jgi:hypothetical protein